MGRIEKTVFLSYRRTNAPWALAIFQNLTQHGYDVFLDYDGIASGDFEQVILENIAARAHFVVLLTPSALKRCNEPADYFRREIETALSTRRNIVPLMLEGFDFRTPSIATQLTGDLALLEKYSAPSIPPEYFLEAMTRLREKFLEIPLDAVLHPASLSAQRVATDQKAAAAAAEAVTSNELTAQEWYERAFSSKDPGEQISLLEKAIHLQPDYPMAYCLRAMARQQKGDTVGAFRDTSEALRLNPHQAEAFLLRAVLLYKAGNVADAIRDFDEAHRLEPASAQIVLYRGDVRYKSGDLSGSIQDFTEAIKLDPKLSAPFNNRGLARLKKGDLSGAIQDCDEAIRLAPHSPTSFTIRGFARSKTGDLEGAMQDYDEAIRQDPRYSAAFEYRAYAHFKKADFVGCVRDYLFAIILKLIRRKVIAYSHFGFRVDEYFTASKTKN